MRLDFNVACRHYKGCRRTRCAFKLNGYARRFASPFVKEFSLYGFCGYGHGFAGFCRRFVYGAVHHFYFKLFNSLIGCLKGHVACRHIELDFRFAEVHTRGIKPLDFPLIEVHIGCRSVCRHGDFRLIGCHFEICRCVFDGDSVNNVFVRCFHCHAICRHLESNRRFCQIFVCQGNSRNNPLLELFSHCRGVCRHGHLLLIFCSCRARRSVCHRYVVINSLKQSGQHNVVFGHIERDFLLCKLRRVEHNAYKRPAVKLFACRHRRFHCYRCSGSIFSAACSAYNLNGIQSDFHFGISTCFGGSGCFIANVIRSFGKSRCFTVRTRVR